MGQAAAIGTAQLICVKLPELAEPVKFTLFVLATTHRWLDLVTRLGEMGMGR